jgi:hypothetical protein
MEHTESSASSPVEKMFPKCFVMAGRFTPNNSAIYALLVDYSADAPLTKEFFATVQNKLHWAITGQTAAELIYASADATKIYLGLTTWKHAPGGKILKSDVTVARNYLSEPAGKMRLRLRLNNDHFRFLSALVGVGHRHKPVRFGHEFRREEIEL